MSKSNQLHVTMFAVIGDRTIGPINSTFWDHHTPELITNAMDAPYGITPQMQTSKPQFLYNLRKHKKLDKNKKLIKQGISSGDILILSDQSSEDAVFGLGQVLADLAGIQVKEPDVRETRLSAGLRSAIEAIPVAGKTLAVLVCGPKR